MTFFLHVWLQVVLDMKGGPNWAGNFVDAPILADTMNQYGEVSREAGKVQAQGQGQGQGQNEQALSAPQEGGGGRFYKQPMFYYMGHFSRFIPEGSVRVGAKGSGVDLNDHDSEFMVAAFQTPADEVVVVVMNRGASPRSFTIDSVRASSSATQTRTEEQRQVEVKIPARAIQTYIYSA